MIHVAVIGHHTRHAEAEALTSSLNAHLFMDDSDHGARWNHDRALTWGRTLTGHLLVVEDDTQPVRGFLKHAEQWISDNPDDLISYYLGTSYPPAYQPTIKHLLTKATDRIHLPTLIHAVAYSIPCHLIPTLSHGQPDLALGRAWRTTTGRAVIYTNPSLVQHTDLHSIQNNGRRPLPRHAHNLGAPTNT